MRKLVSSALAAIGVLVSTSVLAQPIKIGAPQPMTGPDAPFGDKFKKAYTMALEEINAAGGVNGRKLEILIEDHQAKNQLAATVAEKLITEEKVLVMTGGRGSGQAMEIASICQRLKTPYLVDHPSADMITSKGFRSDHGRESARDDRRARVRTGDGDRIDLPAAEDAVPRRPPVRRHDHLQGIPI